MDRANSSGAIPAHLQPHCSSRSTAFGSPSPEINKGHREATYSKDGIRIRLHNADLWHRFHALGNEMIVTKSGRRLFPHLQVNLRELNPEASYNISLRIDSVDNNRYKCVNGGWIVSGKSDTHQERSRQIYLHPNSPGTGSFWMKKPVSFKLCKITHHKSSQNQYPLLLNSMHKYVMAVVVREVESGKETSILLSPTEFVTVTAYQNPDVTQLKIDNNSFASGFRKKAEKHVPETYPHEIMPHLPLSLPPINATLVIPNVAMAPPALPSMNPTVSNVPWTQPQYEPPLPPVCSFDMTIPFQLPDNSPLAPFSFDGTPQLPSLESFTYPPLLSDSSSDLSITSSSSGTIPTPTTSDFPLSSINNLLPPLPEWIDMDD